MYRDEEQVVNEDYEDLRKSKCFNPYITAPYCAMPCPMQMPMMQEPYQSIGQCPMCGKSTNWRDGEDFDLDDVDNRDDYSRPYYPHNNKPNHHPYYPPYYSPYHKPYYKPYYNPYHHPYGPWWMKRDFEE